MSKRDSKRRMQKAMLILNFLLYNFLEVELRGCDHDLLTVIEHLPFIVRSFIYSVPQALS